MDHEAEPPELALIRRATDERVEAIQAAILEVGLAGGGRVYVEAPQVKNEGGRLTVSTRVWKVPRGSREPEQHELPHTYEVFYVTPMYQEDGQ